MKFWRFALFGITGDLATRKILPSLAQFASKNTNDVSIDLIGYSRSIPNTKNIEHILNSNSTKSTHALKTISYIQSEYDDVTAIKQLIAQTPTHQTLYIYLAVPPDIIIKFLTVASKFIDSHIHIIIEKPFGRNSQEAQAIAHIIKHYDIERNIHFIDHYLFKSTVRLSKLEQNNFKFLHTKQIRSIHIQALETLGVEDRKSYYADTGAFKDMFSHLYALTSAVCSLLGRSIDDYKAQPQSIIMGQYQSFLNDIHESSSTTDTYFTLTSHLKAHNGDIKETLDRFGITLVFESGKRLGTKKTHITVTFRDGSTLDWNIAPTSGLVYSDGTDLKEIHPRYTDLSDHENMFLDLLADSIDSFFTSKRMLNSWNIYNKSNKLEGFTHPPFVYIDNSYPPQPANAILPLKKQTMMISSVSKR